MNSSNKDTPSPQDWSAIDIKMKEYSTPSIWKGIWQVLNSLIPYLGLWVLIIYSLSISWWITAFLILIAAGFLVRIFIIFHDCGHGSFFPTKWSNQLVGMFLGILAFTPYHKWHKQHMNHHATVANLDERGFGDVWTMTTDEYKNSSNWQRIKYKLYRNPIAMFGVGPLLLFLVLNRFTKKGMTKKEKRNVYFTNLVLILIFIVMGLSIGFLKFLIIQLLILNLAAIGGMWLFYLQHQFEDVSWFRNSDWNFKTVALEGSSYIKFPKILQWFSGNIGFHHIHHLNPRIPNYNLQKCFTENKIFQNIKPVTFWGSLKTLKLRLWDEEAQKLVAYTHNGK